MNVSFVEDNTISPPDMPDALVIDLRNNSAVRESGEDACSADTPAPHAKSGQLPEEAIYIGQSTSIIRHLHEVVFILYGC